MLFSSAFLCFCAHRTFFGGLPQSMACEDAAADDKGSEQDSEEQLGHGNQGRKKPFIYMPLNKSIITRLGFSPAHKWPACN